VQDIGHAHGAYKPPRDSMSRTLLSLAGFQVIITGRFWVIAEDPICANLLLFNTKPNCSRAGLIVGKSLILKSSKNVEGPIRLAGAVISQP
ncbi:MAG: hypothetical protein WBQ19_09430, partial [Terriglobales bacterium]